MESDNEMSELSEMQNLIDEMRKCNEQLVEIQKTFKDFGDVYTSNAVYAKSDFVRNFSVSMATISISLLALIISLTYAYSMSWIEILITFVLIIVVLIIVILVIPNYFDNKIKKVLENAGLRLKI